MSKQKSRVFCEKPEDPPFIKRMKERIGFQAGPTVETKKEILPKEPVGDDDSESEVEEEQPTIVVLKKGDLNEDEVKAIREEEGECVSQATAPAFNKFTSDMSKPKKIVFKKPEKSLEKKSDLMVSSTKRGAEEERTEQLIKKHSLERGSSIDKSNLKKTNLLSFGGDEEEEDS